MEKSLLQVYYDKSKGNSREREKRYYEWEQRVYREIDQAENLIFSGILSDGGILEFLHPRAGHLDRDRNHQSWELMSRVRARKTELSPYIRIHVDWVLNTFGW